MTTIFMCTIQNVANGCNNQHVNYSYLSKNVYHYEAKIL